MQICLLITVTYIFADGLSIFLDAAFLTFIIQKYIVCLTVAYAVYNTWYLKNMLFIDILIHFSFSEEQ